MAGTSLLALIDDIATILDDVATMTKVATKKTAGVLGDDLALNAEQVTGVNADRELPVVFAVAKGSAINKAILVPAALLISWLIPWAVTPLLMIGGAFLCYEGFHKVAHKVFHNAAEDEEEHEEHLAALQNEEVDMVEFEKAKIKGAVTTDFILSAEIIAIVLGEIQDAEFATRVAVLVTVSVLFTVGVYGLVAAIVKLDDLGLHLSRKGGGSAVIGDGILKSAPYLMKGLGIVGTIAMFLVGGGILAHGTPGIPDVVHAIQSAAGPLAFAVETVVNGLVGVIAGGIIVGVISGIQKARGKSNAH